MRNFAHRRTIGVVAGLAAGALIAAGCGGNDTSDVASASSTGSAAAASTTASAGPAGSSPSSTGAGASSASASAHHSSGSKSASSAAAVARSGEVMVKGVDGSDVTLTGPIAAKYSAATDAQKKGLGPVLVGSRNAGTRDSGVIYQQFKSGVITAKNANAGTPAYITWGRIRDAWNIERDPAGKPVVGGKNGSAGPLGAVTSDETTSGTLKQTTFEHGKITFDTKTGKTEVTVNGKVVPAGL